MRKVTKSVLLCLVLAVVLGLILKPENVNAAETATAYQQRNPIRQVNGETLKKQNNGI